MSVVTSPLRTKDAWEIVGGLSEPSKMPGWGYGLPATECVMGSALRHIKGSVCASCYALKYRYVFPNTLQAQYRRLESLKHPLWVEAMSLLINSRCKGEPYFRWHDSGDLQGVWHLENIVQVCLNTPNVRHWLPTREYSMVKAFLAKGGTVPDNLCIRISAHMVGGNPPSLGLPTSTVSPPEKRRPFACPARAQGNVCGTCRACWDPSIPNVDYELH